DERLDGQAVVGVDVAAGDEVIGQGPYPVAGPGLEGGDELDLVDQPVLERKQAEEEMVGGGHVGLRGSRMAKGIPASSPGCPVRCIDSTIVKWLCERLNGPACQEPCRISSARMRLQKARY